MSDETARWALYEQADEINQNFRTVWQIYLTFYTANLSVNVVALAFVHGAHVPPKVLGWLTFAFVGIDALVALSSLFVRAYTRRTAEHSSALATDIADFATAHGESIDATKCFRQTIPLPLCEWAAWANIAGMVLVSIVWIAIWRLALAA